MRLLRLEDGGEFSLVEFTGKNIPPYAILSHTWGEDYEEVTYKDIVKRTAKTKAGYAKIRFCGKQTAKDGLQYFWVDTCCINKTSSAELAEAINSMFRWYQDAARCYVYLSDISLGGSVEEDEFSRRWEPAFKKSRWFTRGWTLQELIAPASVEFFSKEEQRLGDKQSLKKTLHEITGIDIQALQGSPLSQFSTDERMLWAENRQTKREEDKAYSLLGIFGIYMPLIYGEGRENALNRLQKQIRESSKGKTLSLEEKRRIMLASLRFDQIDARQMTIKDAHTKTCKWLLKKSEYRNWLDNAKLGEHCGFLWIKGKPGTGKSTLMKFALANAQETMEDRIIISFFFNARGHGLEKSTIGTYQSLLLQLLEQVPTLQDVFDWINLSSPTISTNHQWSVESLKTLLKRAIQRLKKSSIVCFIDALDECEEGQIRDMISFFEQVGGLATSSGIEFRVCFSSRHYPHITVQKGLDLVLEGQEGHNQDITNYLSSELKIGHGKGAEDIRKQIQEKSSGIFMWAVLVAGILNKEHDGGRVHALRRRVQEIPSDLHELFRDILTRDSDNRDELVLCVQWVLFSTQPLSPEQLYLAILSGVETKALLEWDSNEVTRDAIERFIIGSSKGLAEVVLSPTPKVQFIHESVKDFFLKDNGLKNIWPDLGSNFQGQSHERLKHCCLNYMSVSVSAHPNICKSLPKASSQEAAARRKSVSGAFPFLDYAVHNTLYHADVAAGCGITQENFLQSFSFDGWIKLDNLFKEDVTRRHTDHVSLLYVLAEGNMSNLIKLHPSILSCFAVEKERYGSPLFAALATGSRKAVQTFVEAHAATQSPENWFHRLCTRYRYIEGSLDRFGHDFRFSNRRTLLSYLGELGDEVIFAFGLETGNIIADSKDQDGRTPLWWAARNGHEEVFKLLLDTSKLDVDTKDRHGQTPLWWAARNGHEVVLKLLLNTRKVDFDTKDRCGQTPLWWAVRNQHEVVFKLLLDTGKVDVNTRDLYGQSPLWWAARNRHEMVFKQLLNTGKVDVEAKDLDGRTPLLRAVDDRYEVVVKLLVDTGKVNADARGLDGQTPLLRAVDSGLETIVKLLLDTGKVDVNAKDRDGQTPLLRAIRNGHREVIKLLIDTSKVDVDAKDNYGQTPLWWAARSGQEAVVKMLLDTGKVNLNTEDDLYGQTPLWWATRNQHEAVVKLLLDTGKVDIDMKDRDREVETLPSSAASNGHEAVVARRRKWWGSLCCVILSHD